MDLEEIKRGLRAEIKKRENEQYFTFQCNVRQMCKDVLAKLEEQESEIAELKRIKDENEALRSKNEGLLYALADAETNLAMSTRWRKCSEELPQNGQNVWAYNSKSKSVLRLEYEKSDKGEGFIVFPYMHDFLQNITQWMPFEKPKAPEEADK